MKIIANHAHIFQDDVNENGSIESLRRVLDECEIDRAVCFAPFKSYYKDEGMSPNKWLFEKIKNDNRFLAFGTIDFDRTDFKEQVQEIYDCGFNGIKIHPAYQKVRVDGEKTCKVYEEAEKLGLPISFHTGVHWYRISEYNTLLYDEVAYRFPKLKICMEHVGGYSFFKEAVAVMINNGDRIYGGLTSVFDRKENKFWYLGKENVKDLIWQTGINQCVFGLDFPYNSAEKIKDAVKCMRECVLESGLGEKELELVFGGNLERMIIHN